MNANIPGQRIQVPDLQTFNSSLDYGGESFRPVVPRPDVPRAAASVSSRSVPQQRVPVADHPQIRPLCSLTVHNPPSSWTVMCRVTHKSELRTYANKAKSESSEVGKVFSFEIVDKIGDCYPCKTFGTPAQHLHDSLEVGKMYYFSKGSVQSANRKFTSCPSPVELVFDENSIIYEAEDDPSVQHGYFVLTPLRKLKSSAFQNGSCIDVLGVVVKDAFSNQRASKVTQERTYVNNIKLADTSRCVCDFTYWGDDASTSLQEGTIVILKNAKLKKSDKSIELQGGKVLAGDELATVIDRNKDLHHQVTQLAKFWESSTRPVPEDLSSVYPKEPRKRLVNITEEGLGLTRDETGKSKPDTIVVRCFIDHIRADNLIYHACPSCDKKCSPDGGVDTLRCETCSLSIPIAGAKCKFLVTGQVKDDSGQNYFTMFDRSAYKIIDQSAKKLENLDDRMNVARGFSMKHCVVVATVKSEIYNDEEKVKVVVDSIHPVNYRLESRILIDHIKQRLPVRESPPK